MNRKWRRRPLNQPHVKRILTLFLCVVLLLSTVPAAFAAEPANNQTVKAGVFFFDGYHMRDSDGKYTGYGIELLNLISQYSHLNFELTGYDCSWKETQSMLLSGEIDVVTSARKTRERTETFLFSQPISLNNTVLTVQAQNESIVSGDYSTYDGMTVGLLAGNSQNRFLPVFAEENGFTYQTREYEDSARLAAELQNGTIDAILTSNLRRAENERLLDTIKIDYFYAITRKDDQGQALIDEINYALSQMNLYEGDWSNVLYNRYYGTEVSTASGFTQRELDYIDAVASGKKRITVTAMPDRKPYSYVEDGELKGILPRFFDSLMQMAELSYEVVVPSDREEYDRLTKSGDVDVVIDWHQTTSMEKEYIESGFLTDTYMNTGVALLTRKGFNGSVSSLAIAEDQKYLPLEYEQFKSASIEYYPVMADVVQAVLDGKADAAFMRTHAAQYFINNDTTNSLAFNSIDDSEQIAFNMYIPSGSDHELVTILNKCIQQVPDDVLSRLITEYTSSTPENVAFFQYMSAHPEAVLLMSGLVVLALGVILFFYLRSRWNSRLLQTTEHTNQELKEQLAIVNALSRDYATVYKLDMRAATLQVLKTDSHTPVGRNWKTGETVPYAKALRQYVSDRVVEEDRDDLTRALSLDQVRQALSANSEYSGTFRARIGEETHHFQFNCVSYRAEGQTESHALLGLRNIDKIVQEEQQQKAVLEDALQMARAASEAKTAFLSSMSHDIRTPMNAIIGFLALMRDETDNPAMVAEYIQRIDAASQHLLGLINDILDMSRIESGSATLNVSEMNLAEIINEINTIIRPQAKEKDQTFDICVSHLKYEHLLGDKVRINQILINLLSNAVKYTPQNGTIEMRVEELPQVVSNYSRVRFTIQDNGFGMSEEYLKVIFDPFTREERKDTYGIQGTGLGMPITKSLVDMMGGSIRVESEPDKGSTFIVELELRIQEEALRETDPEFWRKHKLTRMIVTDDDEQVCKNIVKTMTRTGVVTDYATDGEKAVQMICSAREAGSPYDLMLLDWQMPTPNGLETTRLIQKNYPDKIPIILLTSFDWSEIEQEAREIGISHFMPKPFFMSTFKAAVQRVMSSPEKERAQTDIVRGKCILVVDDIEVNRIILVKILSSLGAECDTAANGQEAAEKFEASQPGKYDLILMDVQMPIMNGYEATKVIRASGHPSAKTVSIIAMTANAFVDDVRDALESGMDAHLAKPVQIDNLKATIQQVLESRAAAEN